MIREPSEPRVEASRERGNLTSNRWDGKNPRERSERGSPAATAGSGRLRVFPQVFATEWCPQGAEGARGHPRE